MAVPNEQLSMSDILAALNNVQRRNLLYQLRTHSPPDDAESSGIAIESERVMCHIRGAVAYRSKCDTDTEVAVASGQNLSGTPLSQWMQERVIRLFH